MHWYITDKEIFVSHKFLKSQKLTDFFENFESHDTNFRAYTKSNNINQKKS